MASLVGRCSVGVRRSAVRRLVRSSVGTPPVSFSLSPRLGHRAVNRNISELKALGCRTLSTGVSPSDSSFPANVNFVDETILRPESKNKDIILDQKWYADRRTDEPAVLPVFSFFEPEVDSKQDLELDSKIWKADVRLDIIHRVVRWYRAKQRQGTHKQKTISERSGTGKKPHPQKGTGRARQGTLRAPHMRGGGRVHGKVPRDYSFNLPIKVLRYGLRSTLSAKLIEKSVIVVDKLYPDERQMDSAAQMNSVPIKTKDALSFLKKHNWQDDSVMFVDDTENEYLMAAVNNLAGDKRVVSQENLNVYDLLKVNRLVISKSAVEALKGRLQSETGNYLSRREGKFQTEITSDQIAQWEENAKAMREKAQTN